MNGVNHMVDDLDTPPGMEPSSDGVPQWLVLHITQIKNGLKNNYNVIGDVKKDVREVKAIQKDVLTQLARTDQKIENHVQQHRDNPGNTNSRERPSPHTPSNNPNSVTYKWITDWGIRIGLIFFGGIVTLILKLIADVLTK